MHQFKQSINASRGGWHWRPTVWNTWMSVLIYVMEWWLCQYLFKKNSDQNAGWLVQCIKLFSYLGIVINHYRRIPINQSMEWNVNQGFWFFAHVVSLEFGTRIIFRHLFVNMSTSKLRIKHHILWLALISSKTKFLQSWFQFRISKVFFSVKVHSQRFLLF